MAHLFLGMTAVYPATTDCYIEGGKNLQELCPTATIFDVTLLPPPIWIEVKNEAVKAMQKPASCLYFSSPCALREWLALKPFPHRETVICALLTSRANGKLVIMTTSSTFCPPRTIRCMYGTSDRFIVRSPRASILRPV